MTRNPIPSEAETRIARAIDPEIWELFDARAIRKEWTPDERAEEFAETVAKGGRMAKSLQAATRVLATLPPQERSGDARERQLQALWDAHREYLGYSPSPFPKERADSNKLYGLMVDKLAALGSQDRSPPIGDEQ